MKKFLRRIFNLIKYGTLSVLLFLLATNLWVVGSTKAALHENAATVPDTDVALVLGTSKRSASGNANLYFRYRMEAAAKLYQMGKVKHLLLSGDNSSRYYNEPKDMLEALQKLGVPAEAISLDYAGLRTLDSVVRSKEIFGQNRIIIISQGFHCSRAVFIARHYNIEASAYVARNASLEYSWKVVLREVLARPKAVIDLYLLGKDPKYLGEKVELDI